MRKHSKTQDEAAIDMTPMLDIVFIMLIFFIVTASFLKEAGIDLDRKVLSDIAIHEPESFRSLVEQAQAALDKAA